MDVQLLTEPLHGLLSQAIIFLPRLLIAVLIFLVGWVLARAARFAIVRGLRAINFNVLGERSGLNAFLRSGGIETDLAGIVGFLGFWFVVIGALVIACNSLGLAYVTEILSRLMLFVPNLIAGLLILALGAYFAIVIGNAVSGYCGRVGARDAELLGNLARYAVLIFVVLIALDQISIGGQIVRETFLILFAGLVFAAALAFGLGGREWAARMLEHWWPSKNDKPEE